MINVVQEKDKLTVKIKGQDHYLSNKLIKTLRSAEQEGLAVRIICEQAGLSYDSVADYVSHIDKVGRIKAERSLAELQAELAKAKAELAQARSDLRFYRRKDSQAALVDYLSEVARKVSEGDAYLAVDVASAPSYEYSFTTRNVGGDKWRDELTAPSYNVIIPVSANLSTKVFKRGETMSNVLGSCTEVSEMDFVFSEDGHIIKDRTGQLEKFADNYTNRILTENLEY